ncbi:PAS domain S-box-containing protein [Granulicella rosea]|uniref:histidine kinase n=2 Tax=Granulicella rosea TaxID=474952 RepID=A0A239IB08_9BACT|nr:PAS domain S-box-containing protein [Granulicella rosea]
MNPTLVKDDALRAEALEQYGLVEAAPDPVVDDLVRLAAQLCGVPMAGVAMVGAESLFVNSRVGPGPSRVPRGNTPIEQTILGDTVYEVPDARYHADFSPDGIMIAGRTYRFFAGAPLTTPAGVTIGCLFVQDVAPRKLTLAQIDSLAVLGRQVVAHYELNCRIRQMDKASRASHRVESALTVERNFVSTVLDTVGALVAVFDTAGRIVRFNRACEVASGYDFASLVGRYLWEKLIPVADIPEAIASFERLRGGKFPASFENQWKCRDGSIRRIAWTATALVDRQGQTTFLISTGIDVTTQRGAEATLRESEARYRQLVEGSLGMVGTHDLNGKMISINTTGAQSLGFTVEEIVGRNLADLMPRERKRDVQPYLEEVVANGESQGLHYFCNKNGEVRVMAFSNKLIEAPGKLPYILSFGVDITEQVRAEEKLRTLIRQSNSILESVGDGIYGIDLEGRVTVVNPAASQMLGYKAGELLGRRMHELIHHTRPDGTPYPAGDSPIANSIRKLDTVRVSDEVFWRKDGTSFPVEYVARPQIDIVREGAGADGSGERTTKCVGVVVAFTDTTERRALDRMKDEFISTVSHELRTPLTSLRAALGLVSGGALATRPEKMQQMLEIAIGNTDRLARLVNDILDIERISSGKAELHYTMCSADDLLRRAASTQQSAADKLHLHFALGPGHMSGIQVWADPDRIAQTLSNLISNAIKFSPVGGEIALSVKALDENEAQFDVHDQGQGIPAGQLENIFNRFQQVDASDSRIRGGTGLGLAICRSIVTQHRGHIWATSPPGDGATFHFTLPTKASQHLG